MIGLTPYNINNISFWLYITYSTYIYLLVWYDMCFTPWIKLIKCHFCFIINLLKFKYIIVFMLFNTYVTFCAVTHYEVHIMIAPTIYVHHNIYIHSPLIDTQLGETPLMLAAINGNTDIVEELIRRKADVNAHNTVR